MTKLEVIQHLVGNCHREIVGKFTNTWEDEKVISRWNYRSLMDKKGSLLVKKGDEFEIIFQAPLSDFTKDAMNFFNQNR